MRVVRAAFRDAASLPDGGEQILLAHHPFAIFDQVGQNVENLRLEGHEITAEAQFAPVRVERIAFEEIAHLAVPVPMHCNVGQGITSRS